jgi:hypothetical protein
MEDIVRVLLRTYGLCPGCKRPVRISANQLMQVSDEAPGAIFPFQIRRAGFTTGLL